MSRPNDKSARRPARRATLADVARRAGVSAMAASVVLNGARSNTRVSEANQIRIRQAALELDYRPNSIARSLRRRRTDILGFYSGHGNPWWLAEDLQRGCERHRKDLLIHGAYRNNSLDELVTELTDGRIDGLLVVATLCDPLAERLASSNLPAVAVADAVAGLPSVVVDDQAAGQLMAQHLAERGHRRVLYRDPDFPRASTSRRVQAFCQRASALDIIVERFPSAPHPGDLTEAELAALARKGRDRPTAVAAYDNGYLLPALHMALRQGLRIPEDLALIGTGVICVDAVTRLQLTCVRMPWAEVAHRSVDLLIDVIEGKEVARETVLPVELIVGDTT